MIAEDQSHQKRKLEMEPVINQKIKQTRKKRSCEKRKFPRRRLPKYPSPAQNTEKAKRGKEEQVQNDEDSERTVAGTNNRLINKYTSRKQRESQKRMRKL